MDPLNALGNFYMLEEVMFEQMFSSQTLDLRFWEYFEVH